MKMDYSNVVRMVALLVIGAHLFSAVPTAQAYTDRASTLFRFPIWPRVHAPLPSIPFVAAPPLHARTLPKLIAAEKLQRLIVPPISAIQPGYNSGKLFSLPPLPELPALAPSVPPTSELPEFSIPSLPPAPSVPWYRSFFGRWFGN